jgi:hypothetical protein
MRKDNYPEDTRPPARRRTIASIRKKRMTRIIVIPIYLFIIFFLLVPGLLVIFEVSSRLFLESKLLGILATISGFFLGFVFALRLISFRDSELDIQRDLVIVFLAFLVFISIGRAFSGNSPGMGQMLKRYNSSFKTYIKMWEEEGAKSNKRTSEAYVYSNIDSMAGHMAIQPCVKDFFSYASEKYYHDLDAYILYLGVNEVMSVYRVMLEEFEVTADDSDDIRLTDAETIIDNRAGSHTQLTLFFTACLLQFDYKVDVMECINGNLVNMVRINPGYYPHFQNFISNENLNPVLTWYMQEQMVSTRHGFFHWVPLYIPVHNPEPPSPYGKFAIRTNIILRLPPSGSLSGCS